MRSCTVSAPVQSCSASLPSSSSKYAAVELLTKQRLYFVVEVKSRAKDLYSQTCSYLGDQGMLDTELFGLAIVVDGEYLFVDPESKLSKHAPKHWKSSHGHGLDGNGRPSLVLYFRVQFYVDSPLLLRDNESRHHYYLQLRHNVLSRGLLHACASEELLYLLAGLALQADLGDYIPQQHTGNYFNPAEYFPSQMVSTSEQQIMQNLPALHRDNQGMGGEEAKLLYIREASSAEVSPLTHNSHLYRLRHKKQEQGPGSVWLAICAKGIQIYEENSAKTLTATFLWTNIGKLIFDKKKFEIRAHNSLVSEEKYTYYTNTDEKSKHILMLCRATHQFSMAIQPRLSELKRKEEEDIKRYREWLLPATCKTHLNDQRTSVISNTSSNTTSGIVSDRVQSLDESEDDLEVEIMITSPPAPSVESLALAHLQDGPSPIPKGSDEVDHCLTSVRPQKSSPSSSNGGAGGAVTPATTDGSQCSSSCSTVVVAATPGSVSSTTPRSDQQITLSRRRASTSSSLELGYSHTAQNSSVSEDCIGGIDYSVQSAHTSSGIYTLGGETTTATASSQATSSGVFAGGSRSSAGSVASFRGDGSDPPDAPPRSPLSAAELSDLIVGRPLPASDDYPPPPLPPPRTDSDSRYSNGSDELIIPEHLSQSQHSLLNQQNILTSQLRMSQPEEAPARFITTRPHINILTAHTSLVPPTAAPSYAAPTLTYQSANNVIYSPTLKPKPIPAPRRLPLPAQPHLGTSFLGGYASIDPGAKMKVSAPVQTSLIIGKNNYLDVHATRAGSGMLRSTVALAATSPGSSYSAGSGSQFVGAAGTGLMRQNINLGATSPSSSYSAGSCSQFITGGIPGSGMLRSTVALAAASPGSSYSAGSGGQFVTNTVPNANILRSTVALGTSSPGSSYSAGSGSQFIHSHPHPHLHAQQFSPPPPPLHPRQPPPPPPPSVPGQSLATVYTSQVTRGQIEQFQQQMFSDVDYVIYPMRDPAVSKQEYMDAKQGSLIARHCYPNPPPYYPEGRYMYRSTPNVALAVPMTFSGKYASNQNLTASHYPASLYSCSSSSTQSLRYEPQQAVVFPEFLPLGGQSLSQFGRARSDDNILNSYDKPAVTTSFVERPKYRRLPPPPPPPPYEEQMSEKQAVVQESGKGSKHGEGEGVLDIRTLREKSKNLDLPLISALCNDRSLLKQTNAFVMPRHPGSSERPISWHETSSSSGIAGSESSKKSGSNNSGSTLLSAILPGSKHSGSGGNSKLKYPVSGLSTTQISKPQRKVSASTHTHPHAHPELKTKVKNKHREALMP